jgi:hypothetical protein
LEGPFGYAPARSGAPRDKERKEREKAGMEKMERWEKMWDWEDGEGSWGVTEPQAWR